MQLEWGDQTIAHELHELLIQSYAVRMAHRKSVTVSLSSELLAFAERSISSGRYGNVSDVVRSALRLLEEHELDFAAHRERLRASSPASPEVLP